MFKSKSATNDFSVAPIPVKKRQIKFPLVLVLIFFSVQLVLFMLFDFNRVAGKLFSGAQVEGISNEVTNKSYAIPPVNQGIEQAARPPIKYDGNFTSILIAGIDARNVEIENGEFINTKPEGQAGTRNIDSLIQVVYDYSSKKIFMISIPRDMGVDVRLDCFHFSGSIHWLYDKGMRSNCPGKGITTLEAAVETVTGIKVNYYAIISLEAFPQVIDAVGEENDKGEKGIYVENPRSFSDLYPSDNQKGWLSVFFPQGRIFLNSTKALQYSRTRQFTSAFDRDKRQQLVVEAVARRLLSLNVVFDPGKIQSLISIFNKNVLMSQPESLSELLGMISVVKDADFSKIYHMELDPEFGNAGHEAYLNKQPHDRPGGPYYMVPTAWKSCPGNEFCKVQERIRQFIADPGLMQSTPANTK